MSSKIKEKEQDKVPATYYLTAAQKAWIEEQAKASFRSASSFMQVVIDEMMKGKDESDVAE